MKKHKISVVISNPKFSMASLKISLNIIRAFFILISNNKEAKTILIL